MTGGYFHPELFHIMRGRGVVDRYYRFGPDTWEAFVTLSLRSEGGRVPKIQLAIRLLWQQRKEAMWHLLAEYQFAHQEDAHHDALMISGRYGIGLLYSDAGRKWHTLADPDTATVVVPGSIVLWED